MKIGLSTRSSGWENTPLVLGERQLGRILRYLRRQILVDESFQARPVARLGGCCLGYNPQSAQ
jgi:hypothetical protein